MGQPTPTAERSKPLVSVIITTKNRAGQLREAIESVLALEDDAFDVDLVVVDDGSTDETPEVVLEYDAQYVRAGGRGIPAARNAGLASARGDYVALLDDDDVYLPGAIAAQIAVLEADPSYGSAHGQALLVDADLTNARPPVPPGPLTSGDLSIELLRYFPQIGTVVTRASAAAEVGELDVTLPGDSEWDWQLRIADRYPVARVEVPVLMFRQRGTPEEEQLWRRCPATRTIFLRHTRSLPWREQLKLRPVLWRHQGFYAGVFVWFATMNWRAGNRQRAYRSMLYGLRMSPAHAVWCLLRNLTAREQTD
jgi:glycosyltransferase involved in cell wall biosynthesis